MMVYNVHIIRWDNEKMFDGSWRTKTAALKRAAYLLKRKDYSRGVTIIQKRE